MNNATCNACGCKFEMGVDGVCEDGVDLCDQCAGMVRTSEGLCYESNVPYQIYRPITSAYLNSARACPGDFVRVHPHRKVRHA
jgi:hypothetical protein